MIASVEANGWVLRITLIATPGSFASYTLDPDGAPRVQLTSSDNGYAQTSGIAVAAVPVRIPVATKPLRKPVNPASPTTPVIDETDNGDGTITVRLALSEFIYATSSGLSLATAAGWRSGEAGATVAVANASTLAAPLPIFRWADAPYQRQTGPFTLELVAFSHHPLGTAAVAGVRFVVTDGTTVKTVWATAPASSAKYGDNARVYAATLDPATATALTAGLLRCDAEVYPWLGVMRSTDPAGTRSMTGLATAGYGSKAETPFVIGYDPVGTRYAGQVLYIDPAGTATASAAMVKTDLVGAKALATASRPATISTALQALYLANRALPAANGQTAAVRATDGARLVLAAGTHAGAGSTAVTTGLTSSELALIIEGDPDDANPRANCIVQTGTSANARANRVILRNFSWEIGTTTLFSAGMVYYWLDNLEIRAKSGSEANGAAPIAAAVPASQANLFATRSRWWRSASSFQGSTLRFGLLRNCEWSRAAEASAVIGGRFIPASEDLFVSAVTGGVGGWGGASDIGAQEDIVLAGIDLRSVKGRSWVPTGATAASAGTPNTSFRRQVFANNLCERFGTDPQPFWSLGEDVSATMSYNIIEGNSFVGERCNIIYGDPFPTTLAETNSLVNQAFGNRVANNSFDWAATKHDAFNDSQSAALRGGTNGYRPQLTETWSTTYGVGFEGNYDWGRHASAGNFRFEYFGRRGVQAIAGVPDWLADRSTFGSPATGGGSYRPPASSPLTGRALRGSSDRDRAGVSRVAPFASGALEPLLTFALAPAAASSAIRSGTALVGWRGALNPDPGTINGRVSTLALTLGASGLAPASARQSIRDAGAAVLPDMPFDLLFATPRLVRVAGEVRLQFVPAG